MAIVVLQLSHPPLAVVTMETDEGCTRIFRGDGEPLPKLLSDRLFSWESFAFNYECVLNLVGEKDFVKQFSKLSHRRLQSGLRTPKLTRNLEC